MQFLEAVDQAVGVAEIVFALCVGQLRAEVAHADFQLEKIRIDRACVQVGNRCDKSGLFGSDFAPGFQRKIAGIGKLRRHQQYCRIFE